MFNFLYDGFPVIYLIKRFKESKILFCSMYIKEYQSPTQVLSKFTVFSHLCLVDFLLLFSDGGLSIRLFVALANRTVLNGSLLLNDLLVKGLLLPEASILVRDLANESLGFLARTR